MATYIQGLNDQQPPLPVYTPDFGFLQQMLQKKDQMYERGFNQVNSAYNSVLNAQLTVADNRNVRDLYIKQSQEKLKNLAAMDLSMPENVDAASNVFAPFWQDEELLSDYTTTKQIQKGVDQHNTLLNSKEESERKRAWQGGLDYVNLSKRELQNARRGDGSIAKVSARNYVPYVDIDAELDKSFTTKGWKIEKASAQNGYITSVINPNGSKELYDDVVSREINMHPEWRDVFKVRGTNQFYGAVLNHQKLYGSDEATARAEVAKTYRSTQVKLGNQKIKDAEAAACAQQEELNRLEAINKTRGGASSDKEMMELENQLQLVKRAQENLVAHQESLKKLDDPDFMSELMRPGGGEGYFATGFEKQFVEDYSKVRAAAVAMQIHSDPTAVAAASQENQRYMQEERFKHDRGQDIDGDGNDDVWLKAGQVYDDASGMVINADGTRSVPSKTNVQGLRDAASKEVTKQKQLDTGKVGGFYSQNDSATQNTSYYRNMVGHTANHLKKSLDSADSFINSVPAMENDYNGIAKYTKYLKALATGDQQTISRMNVKELQPIFEKLKKDNVITGENYNSTPWAQLDQIVRAANSAAINKSSKGELSEEQIKSRMQYESSAKMYFFSNKVLTDYEKKEFTTNTDLIGAGVYKDGKMVSEKEWVEARIPKQVPRPRLYGDPSFDGAVAPMGDITEDEKARYRTRLKSEYKEHLKKQGSVQDYMGADIDPTTGRTVQDMIMSREISFESDGKDATDKAELIASDVLNNSNPLLNDLQTTEGLVPLNMEQLTKDGGDKLQPIMNMLMAGGSDVINQVLRKTVVSRSGPNGNSVARFLLDHDRLNKLLENTNNKSDDAEVKKAVNSLITYGLTFPMSVETHEKYVEDNYLPDVISKEVLASGVKGSEWEKEFLHYDYTISEGANGGYKVAMRFKTINPATGVEDWVNADENIDFSSEFNFNDIIKNIRMVGSQNTTALRNYFRLKRQQAANTTAATAATTFTRLPNETTEAYVNRYRQSKQ